MKLPFAILGFALVLPLPAAAQSDKPPLPILPKTGGIAPATSSRDNQLTPAQKTAILQAVKQENRKIAAPSGVPAQPGAELPPSIELYLLPDPTLAEIPAAKNFKYTVVDKQVVLVDPTTMRVVEVLGE
jgi:hypothetical protein